MSRNLVLCGLVVVACSHRPEPGGIFVVQTDDNGVFGTWSIDCTRSARDCVMPLDAGAPLLPELASWDSLRGREPLRCSAGKVCGGEWTDGGLFPGYTPATRLPGPVPQPR